MAEDAVALAYVAGFAEIHEANRARMTRTRWGTGFRLGCALPFAGVALALVLLQTAVMGQPVADSPWLLVVMAVMMAGMPALLAVPMARQAARQGPLKVVLAAGGISVTSGADGEFHSPWGDFGGYRETRNGFALLSTDVMGPCVMVLPKSAAGDPDTLARVREVLADRLPAV